jgi:selenocysteine lyase/cysteine desulfurase
MTESLTDAATFRAAFPVFERLSYLNAGTEGPVPSRAADAVHRRMDLEATQGRCGRPYFEELMQLAARLRAGYAAVLGCGPEEVALTGSTTDGVNTELADHRRGASRTARAVGASTPPPRRIDPRGPLRGASR